MDVFPEDSVLTCVSLNRTAHILSLGPPYQKTSLKIHPLILLSLFLLLHVKRIRDLFQAALLSAIALPAVLTILLAFSIYRSLVDATLKLRNGPAKYGGLLPGADAVWAIEDGSKCVITILVMVRFEGRPTEFLGTIKSRLHTRLFAKPKFPKLLATLHSSCGYFYLRRNEITVDDCVRPLEKGCENGLYQRLSDLSRAPLPKNDTALWQVFVGQQEIQWNEHETDLYPLVFRVHHSLSDGLGLLGLLLAALGDNGENPQPKIRPTRSTGEILVAWMETLLVLLKAPSALLVQAIARQDDESVVHGQALSGEKVLVANTERSKVRVETIKRAKKGVEGCSFTDVLLAAVSGGFREYFQMNSQTIPETVTTVIPALLSTEASSLGNEEVLTNRFSVALFDLPLTRRNPPPVDLLRIIRKKTAALRSGIDYKINYWILNVIAAVLPQPLLNPLVKSTQATAVVSSLQGPSRAITILDGLLLRDVVFWVPNRGTTGLGLSILSYDGRLRIGLNADRALICDEIKAQSLIDAIIGNLTRMGSNLDNDGRV